MRTLSPGSRSRSRAPPRLSGSMTIPSVDAMQFLRFPLDWRLGQACCSGGSQQLGGDRLPFRGEIAARGRPARLAIPVAGIAEIALDAMQIGMHPGSVLHSPHPSPADAPCPIRLSSPTTARQAASTRRAAAGHATACDGRRQGSSRSAGQGFQVPSFGVVEQRPVARDQRVAEFARGGGENPICRIVWWNAWEKGRCNKHTGWQTDQANVRSLQQTGEPPLRRRWQTHSSTRNEHADFPRCYRREENNGLTGIRPMNLVYHCIRYWFFVRNPYRRAGVEQQRRVHP